ncbi:MAG: hypothetical protein IK126_10745 [Bacteroidales bacterium]|nr:hypothetical protein [Bacteroidales bacterium]
MKYSTLFPLAVLAASVMSVACNNNISKENEEGVGEENNQNNYVEWDEVFTDSTCCYVLCVKKEGDTVIRFDYRVDEGGTWRRSISGTAVNKYGWLACEFIECGGGTLIPADEYWWEDSVSLGIRIGMNGAHCAEVRSESERWNSPMLYHFEI